MIDFKNKIYIGSDDRESVFDCRIDENSKAVIIFVHGYKGFKDWGAWNLMESAFVRAGFGFVKFNMSHNGGTVAQPIDFPDLDAFGNNMYSYELNDLETIVTEVHRMIHQELEVDIPIYLLGHSRGGGVVILHGANDDRISKIASLAGICDIGSRFLTDEKLKEWEKSGVMFVKNGRTGQEMPHYFSFYEDFTQHQDKLDIEQIARGIETEFLQIHGNMDEAVSISEGSNIAMWTDTELKIIKGTGHTFGASHPWLNDKLPEALKEATDAAIEFFNTQPS